MLPMNAILYTQCNQSSLYLPQKIRELYRTCMIHTIRYHYTSPAQLLPKKASLSTTSG